MSLRDEAIRPVSVAMRRHMDGRDTPNNASDLRAEFALDALLDWLDTNANRIDLAADVAAWHSPTERIVALFRADV